MVVAGPRKVPRNVVKVGAPPRPTGGTARLRLTLVVRRAVASQITTVLLASFPVAAVT